ncbi:MAG TPA: hypothetical protein VK537_04540, partial [Galbitalea sp.]|nr:hypothetical protein [Galbitalea sp.]
RLPARYGLGIGLILQNRGEFALILVTLATAAGLDPRLTPFAGLYVLVMSIIGPILTVNSERITSALFRGRHRTPEPVVDSGVQEAIALMEGATGGQQSSETSDAPDGDDEALLGHDEPEVPANDAEEFELDPTVQQAMEQSDERSHRKRDPEY